MPIPSQPLDLDQLDGVTPVAGAEQRYDEEGRPIVDLLTCGNCGRTWNDAAISAVTPVPAGRCPFEYEHEPEDEEDAAPALLSEVKRQREEIARLREVVEDAVEVMNLALTDMCDDALTRCITTAKAALAALGEAE